ncbi:MAG: hypothetical protein FK733_12515 [Asgard group archaeon]|nr:hypothetical protein [Asgard group archaeon]
MEKMQRTIRYLYWLIVPVLTLTIALGIYYYPEPYKFFQEFLSDLGGQYSTNEGHVNQVSSIIMSVGFGLCGLIALIVFILYFVSDLRYKYLKGSINLVLAFGACLIAIPHDKGNLLVLHTVGAALFMGGYGIINFILQLLRFVRKRQELPDKKSFDFYLDASVVILVFLIILILLIVFIPSEITHNPILRLLSVIFQKLVIIVDCIAILLLDLDDM